MLNIPKSMIEFRDIANTPKYEKKIGAKYYSPGVRSRRCESR